MSQYNIPFLPSGAKIVNADGTMTDEMQSFMQGISTLVNNNFQSSGLKLPTINAESNTNENGSAWYNNKTKTAQIRIDGKTHTIDTTST